MKFLLAVEEKLPEQCPSLRNKDNYYIVNATKIEKFKTIKDNKIFNGNTIMIISNEKDKTTANEDTEQEILQINNNNKKINNYQINNNEIMLE